jgi:membrane-bound inhibitor of C-type lysozyme
MKRMSCLALATLIGAGSACGQDARPVATVEYRCQQGKSLTAAYFDGPTRTAPDGRPIPGGRVELTLADGKRLALPQTLSGSGIRYANEGDTFVFWSKGDTAFIEEGPNRTVTYSDCVRTKK